MSNLAFGLLVVATLPFVLLYVLQDRMIFPAPNLERMPDPPAGFSEVTIETPDGETPFGLFRPPCSGRPTIIVFHGNGDAAAFQHAKADALTRSGFGVLPLSIVVIPAAPAVRPKPVCISTPRLPMISFAPEPPAPSALTVIRWAPRSPFISRASGISMHWFSNHRSIHCSPWPDATIHGFRPSGSC